MNKQELLDKLTTERALILETLDRVPEEEIGKRGVVGDWSVKDILSHLNYWEAELIKLLWQAQQGQTPTTIHFGKKSADELNEEWYENARERPIDRILADFEAIRKQTIRRVSQFSENNLNSDEAYHWLKGYPLWTWIANDTYEHEREHREQIESWLEENK